MNKKSGSKRRRPDETHTAATTSSGESNQENIQAKQQRLEGYLLFIDFINVKMFKISFP